MQSVGLILYSGCQVLGLSMATTFEVASIMAEKEILRNSSRFGARRAGAAINILTEKHDSHHERGVATRVDQWLALPNPVADLPTVLIRVG